MNNRIKEFIEQCTSISRHSYEGRGGGYDIEYFDKEKFAELIIKECGYCADIFEAAGCPVDMDPTETKPSDYIKRQMGIE